MDRTRLDERALVEQAKNDREAFGILYERHVDNIYSYFYYRTGNSHDAEDLTTRVFMRAIQHIGTYEDRGVPFSAWLYRIAHNMLANFYRDRGKRQMVPLDSVAERHSDDGPEKTAESVEDRQTLLAAIRRQSADRQELLILKFVDQMSNAEIGQILDRSEGAIKSLYFRTLVSLRDDLLETTRQEKASRMQKTGKSKEIGNRE
jgi:RNA polymerase sigma-70 factor (ECF subfamily)